MNNASQTTRGLNAIFIHSSVDDAGLTTQQFRVLAHISRRAGDGVAWASNDSMAKICRIHPDTVVESLKELERRKIISRHQRPGKTTCWSILPPSEWNITPPLLGAGYENDPPALKGSHPPALKGSHPPALKGEEGDTFKGIQKGNPKEGEGAIASPAVLVAALPEEVAVWNSKANLRKVQAMSSGRMKALKARRGDPYFTANWRTAVDRVAASSFCNGENDRGWRADFDFFLRPDTVVKVMEGKYDDRKVVKKGPQICY